MEFKDYYQILGVKRDAAKDEIKRAYRRLARKYHPDVSKEADAEQRFKEVGEAYEVLKDPKKRAAYDRLGKDWKAGQEFRPPPDWSRDFDFKSGGFTRGDAGEFSDFFESLFGGAFGGGFGSPFEREFGAGRQRRANQQARGEDLYVRVSIDLENAYRGGSRTLTLQSNVAGGQQRVRERTFNVRIPRGVRQGQHIRLAKQGGPGQGGGEPGDLYLEVAFRPHPFYHVEGKDVYLDLPVAPWEAALGAAVKVPTPEGAVTLKVPPGSAGGRKLRLKGRGIPAGEPGDLYVVLQIVLPPAQNETAREAYRAFAKAFRFNPRSRLGV